MTEPMTEPMTSPMPYPARSMTRPVSTRSVLARPVSTRSVPARSVLARPVLGALAGGLLLALTACSGGDAPVSEGRTPQEVFELAQQKLEEAGTVHLTMDTEALPDGVEGLVSAKGAATNAPAFDGTIQVSYSGLKPTVPVRAVDGAVWATMPLAKSWSRLTPSEYGAPDPSTLLDPDHGFGSLLAQTSDVKEGDSVRGGSGNTEVLTSYTAQVAGKAVKGVMPSAEAAEPFDAELLFSAEGELREMTLTGAFYEGKDSMTYTIGFDDYADEARTITAP